MIPRMGPRIQSMVTMTRSLTVRTIAAAVLLMMAAGLWAQVPKLEPRTPADKQPPVITFEFLFEGAQPPHYALAVEAGGRAAYRSDDVVPPSKGDDAAPPYLVNFVVSSANADRIFELAKALNYFQGDFDFHGGRIANMGAKTLTFKDGETTKATTYNYSQNQNLQQITTLLQGIANALEYRRRLERLYRYEKLGLETELKQMEDDVKRNYVFELQVDESILRQIAGDPSVMNISRRRAENMLQKITSETAETGKQ